MSKYGDFKKQFQAKVSLFFCLPEQPLYYPYGKLGIVGGK